MKQVLAIVVLSMGCGGSSASLLDDQPAEGTRGGPCYPNNTCNAGLACVAKVCGESDAAAGETVAEDTGAGSVDSGAPADAVSADADAAPSGPYAQTTLAAACDTLGDGTNVTGANGDDESSAKLALPFAFKYFGVPVTQYSMASNGFAQLWDAPSGSPSKTPDNIAIPASGAPSGMVAPFWDDLVPQFSEARAGMLGTAPNRRFVISWVHWTIKGETSTRDVSSEALRDDERHRVPLLRDGTRRQRACDRLLRDHRAAESRGHGGRAIFVEHCWGSPDGAGTAVLTLEIARRGPHAPDDGRHGGDADACA